jgi:hypothetical protein
MTTIELRRLAGPLVLAVGLVGLVTLATAGGAGGDLTSIFEYEPDEAAVTPGERIAVDIEVFAGGVAYEVGVDRVNATLAHDPRALTVTDIEPGPWLAQGETDLTVETDIDGEAGTAQVVQTRDPAGQGATGNGTLLTVTVAVAEDATPGNYTLSYGESSVRMVNDHYQPVFTENGTLRVTENNTTADGGGAGRFTLGVATVIALVVGAAVARRVRNGRD